MDKEILLQLANSLAAAAAIANQAVAAEIGDDQAPPALNDEQRAALDTITKNQREQLDAARAEADSLRAALHQITGAQNDAAIQGIVSTGVLTREDGDSLRSVFAALPVDAAQTLRDVLSRASAQPARPTGADFTQRSGKPTTGTAGVDPEWAAKTKAKIEASKSRTPITALGGK